MSEWDWMYELHCVEKRHEIEMLELRHENYRRTNKDCDYYKRTSPERKKVIDITMKLQEIEIEQQKAFLEQYKADYEARLKRDASPPEISSPPTTNDESTSHQPTRKKRQMGKHTTSVA